MPNDAGFTIDQLDAIPPEFTDEALALLFACRHAHELRFCAGWGKWLEWTGTVWRVDPTLAVFDKARAICREQSSQVNNMKVAAAVASAKTVAAIERLARADRRLAATVDQWDADPWLFNTPGVVVDLRTGELRRHRPTDYITKIATTTPGGDCPKWHGFLDEVLAGDADLKLYLQRVIGYSLTGSIREHAMFFAFGTGANGKGVTINTITAIMGDYATVASMDTFTASNSERHSTDLAMLRGARLVTAQETEEGRRWAEAKIKALTGGDPITARFMRQDFFTFAPTFKLVIAGNHRPGLRNVDEAMRRRFNLLPFTVTIPPEKRDHNLPEKLKAEWPGILAWAIQGCIEWQRLGGLQAPASVTEATDEYLRDEDSLSAWIDECCDTASHFHVSTSALFASWKAWADAAGEFVGSQKRFTQALVNKGFVSQRLTGGKSGTVGLNVRPTISAGRHEPEEPPF